MPECGSEQSVYSFDRKCRKAKAKGEYERHNGGN